MRKGRGSFAVLSHQKGRRGRDEKRKWSEGSSLGKAIMRKGCQFQVLSKGGGELSEKKFFALVRAPKKNAGAKKKFNSAGGR